MRTPSSGSAAESKLVRYCLDGNERAWKILVKRFRPFVLRAVKIRLREEGQRLNRADEIASEVWPALFRQECRLLRSYDADRGNLQVFLRFVVRRVVARALRPSYRNQLKSAERQLSRLMVGDADVATTGLMASEFRATLSPCEQQVFDFHWGEHPGEIRPTISEESAIYRGQKGLLFAH